MLHRVPQPGGPEVPVGLSNTELFVSKPDNIACLIDLLSLTDFAARFATVQLLTVLLTNKPQALQDGVMNYPAGIPRLMDTMLDERDDIRDEALLLLVQLTRFSVEIQKAVVFDGAFDRIFEIIRGTFASSTDGGVIVGDCLQLALNLLRDNVSNQNYFRENEDFKKLAAAIKLPMVQGANAESAPALVQNVGLLLEVASALVSGPPSKDHSMNQLRFAGQGLLPAVLDVAFSTTQPVGLRVAALKCVGSAIVNSEEGCEELSKYLGGSAAAVEGGGLPKSTVQFVVPEGHIPGKSLTLQVRSPAEGGNHKQGRNAFLFCAAPAE